ncbi:MAG: DoxX family protein [Alphaproteobacteria bacterium]|nr:DoxX family protein [Alphaproteobacteria bacterium]MDE2109961.1 DoxX family protein [Alphaproteobacteria bacterium]
MSISEFLSPLIGRLVLTWFFLSQVAHYGGDWSGTVSLMTFSGVPAAAFVLLVALMLLILGSLSLLFGFHTRHGAVLLFGVTIVATVLMHNFWQINDNVSARAADFQLFACNVAIAGGLLLLVGMGPGPIALDNRLTGKRKK